MGGGYDMTGTVFADWLQDVAQDELQGIADRAYTIYRTPCSFGDDGLPYTRNEDGLYGMTVTGGGPVRLDGGCGLESMRRIADAIGLSVRSIVNRRGSVAGFTVSRKS
jgi:hypothetical protein